MTNSPYNLTHPHRFVTLLALLITAGCDEGVEGPEFAEGLDDDIVVQDSTDLVRHCVVQAQEDLDPSVSASLEPVCFRHFPDAIEFATGEVIDPDMLPEDYQPMSRTPGEQTTTATYVVGIEYASTNYQGATLTITATSTCASGTKYYPSMASGWDNVPSSAKAYSGCNHSYHYANINYGGALIDAKTASSSLGLLDNNTSSIRFTQ